ncbi:MAG: hypothetical protein JSS67_05970 [Bacteroidetes bacterium]|nr:hypothetical protein [Bacteroidota bacterium]
MKKDSFLLGIILGILSPVVGIIAFYFWKAYPNTFLDFFNVVKQNNSLITALMSFALLANAIVFTFFINKKIDKTAKGIFLITVLFALPVIIYKLFYS